MSEREKTFMEICYDGAEAFRQIAEDRATRAEADNERLRRLLDIAYDHLRGLGYEVDGPTLKQLATGCTTVQPIACLAVAPK